AWLLVDGLSASSRELTAARTELRFRLSPLHSSPARYLPATRMVFVSTTATGRLKAKARVASAEYGPTPGSRSSSSREQGTFPPNDCTIVLAMGMKVSNLQARPSVASMVVTSSGAAAASD